MFLMIWPWLINGFVGANIIDIVKLRIYSPDYHLIAESSVGIKGLAKEVPAFISNTIKQRKGAEKLQAFGGLWTNVALDKSFYTLLLPIGGFKINAYLAITINPLLNFLDISQLTQKKLSIHDLQGNKLAQKLPNEDISNLELEEIYYTLIGKDGLAAYKMILLDDVTEFNQSTKAIRINTLLTFFSLSTLIALIALFIMNKFLFYPLHNMNHQLHRVANGDLELPVKENGLKEFHELAYSFNIMRQSLSQNMQKLEKMARIDELTGLSNRRHFDEVFDKEWKDYQRTNKPLSLLICDIDHFKQYNDTYGHKEGDNCIQQVCQAISEAVFRPLDTACRYGGEEFALILPDTPLVGAQKIAQLINDNIKAFKLAHTSSSVSAYVTLSIGIATMPDCDLANIDDFFKAADKALYQAKENGRNRIEHA